MMNEICANCGKMMSEHSLTFYPDGRVAETCIKYVSVPAAFLEAVRELVFGIAISSVGVDEKNRERASKLRAMLDQITGGTT